MKLVVSLVVCPAALLRRWMRGLARRSPARPRTARSGTKTYQVCSNIDGSVSYDFGGMSCSLLEQSGHSTVRPAATRGCEYCTAVAAAADRRHRWRGGRRWGWRRRQRPARSTFWPARHRHLLPAARRRPRRSTGRPELLDRRVARRATPVSVARLHWTGINFIVERHARAGHGQIQTASIEAAARPFHRFRAADRAGWAEAGSGSSTPSARRLASTITALGPSSDRRQRQHDSISAPTANVTGTLTTQHPLTSMPEHHGDRDSSVSGHQRSVGRHATAARATRHDKSRSAHRQARPSRSARPLRHPRRSASTAAARWWPSSAPAAASARRSSPTTRCAPALRAAARPRHQLRRSPLVDGEQAVPAPGAAGARPLRRAARAATSIRSASSCSRTSPPG